MSLRAAFHAAALLAAAPLAGQACGLHGGLDGQAFAPLHPGSIEVALGVRGLVDHGRVQPLPAAAPPLAFVRVQRSLQLLKARLEAGPPGPATAMLLVDSGLWARWAWTEGRLDMQVHVAGPEAGDRVVLTGEPVLAALLAQQLHPAQAQAARAWVVQGGDGAAAVFH